MRFNILWDTNHNAKVLVFYEAQPKLGILGNGIKVSPKKVYWHNTSSITGWRINRVTEPDTEVFRAESHNWTLNHITRCLSRANRNGAGHWSLMMNYRAQDVSRKLVLAWESNKLPTNIFIKQDYQDMYRVIWISRTSMPCHDDRNRGWTQLCCARQLGIKECIKMNNAGHQWAEPWYDD
jgi:hypothetical protein